MPILFSPVLIPFHFLLSPLQLSPLFPSPVLSHFIISILPLSCSIPFHSLLSPLQFRCCSPLPFYPISFSTLSRPVPPLFSSPVLSHFVLYSLLPNPISFSTLFPPVPLFPLHFSSRGLSHFILYSLPSSATVVLLSRSNPISFSTLFPPVPLLFSSPVLIPFLPF